MHASSISSTEKDDDFNWRHDVESPTIHPPPGDPSLQRIDNLPPGHSLREKFGCPPETSLFHHLHEEDSEPSQSEGHNPQIAVPHQRNHKHGESTSPPEKSAPGSDQQEDEVPPPPHQPPTQPVIHNTNKASLRNQGDDQDTSSSEKLSDEDRGTGPARSQSKNSQSEDDDSRTHTSPNSESEVSHSADEEPTPVPGQQENTVSPHRHKQPKQSQAIKQNNIETSGRTKGDNQDPSLPTMSSAKEREPKAEKETERLYPTLPTGNDKDTGQSPYYNDTDIPNECLHIKFDVLLHPSTRQGANTTKLRLQCLGNLKGKKLKLETLSQRDLCNNSKYQRYVGEAQIPREWLNESHRLQYIYEISSDGKNWKPEYWQDNETNVHHRVLSFSKEELRSLKKWEEKRGTKFRETADAYDGVILIDERLSIMRAFSPGIDQQILLNTIEIVCDEYFPGLEEEHISTKKFLSEFNEKSETFYRRYFSPRNISRNELIERYVKLLLSQTQQVGHEGHNHNLRTAILLLTLISETLERSPSCLTTHQYKVLIDGLTPPLDVEGQKEFCSKFQYLFKPSRSRDEFRKKVIRFCRTSMEVLPVKEAYWLFCLPLIHLLSGQKPFEATKFSLEEEHRFEDKDLEDITNRTAQRLESISHFPFWENHVCFFKMVTPLQHTLMACVPQGRFTICFTESNWVPRNLVIAAVMRHLRKEAKTDATSEKQLCHLLTRMAKDISQENTTVSNTKSDDDLAEKYAIARQTRVAAEQLCDVLKQHELPIQTLIVSLRLLVVAVREEGRLIPLLNDSQGDAYKMRELDEPFSKITQVTKHLFARCEGNIEILVQTAERCIDFEEIGVSSRHKSKMALMKTWETSVCNLLRQCIEKVSAHSLLTYYCKAGKHSVKLDDILTEILEERFEEAYDHNDGKDFWKPGPAFLKIYSSVLENKMNRLPSTAGVPLYHTVLDWPVFLPGLNMLVKHKKFGVTEEAMECLVEVRDELTSLIGSLNSEQILVRDLDMIQSKFGSFQRFAPVLGYKLPAIKGKMTSCFEVVTKFKNTCESISSFFETTNEEIEEKTEILDYLKICDNITSKTIRFLREKQIDLSKALGITPKELRQITSCMESLSFRKIWNDNKSSMNNRHNSALEARSTLTGTWKDLVNLVWKPTLAEWRTFGHSIQTGNITMEEITERTGIQIEDKKNLTNQLRKEFAILDRELDSLRLAEVIEERLTAINDVFDIQSSVRISEIIMKIKETYKLTGDFSRIAAMMKMEKKGIVLRLVDRETVDLSKLLASLPPVMYKCLESFNKGRKLVEWIQTTMKGGQNDIKTFVDLALMAVGESDLDIAKVRCLHSAALGYSRLIFMPSNCTVDDFLTRLKDVQTAFKNDPQLHKKFDDAKASLTKLKSIHNTQRATSDKKSLRQAGQVVKSGTCYVGFHGGTDLELPNVIHVVVKNERDGDIIKFSFADMEDIQSRLMLAGSSEDMEDPKTNDSMSKEETIEKFTMIFDSLRRLGLVYIRLNDLGCSFFREMDVVIYGNSGDSKVCKISFFGKSALKVVKNEHEILDMTEVVKSIATAFENCMEKWQDEIKKARKDFYFLNHFTTKQLILLQDIVHITSSKQFGTHVLPLLSLVLPGCSSGQITTVLGEVSAMERSQQIKYFKLLQE